jgi:hypothetical protein
MISGAPLGGSHSSPLFVLRWIGLRHFGGALAFDAGGSLNIYADTAKRLASTAGILAR